MDQPRQEPVSAMVLPLLMLCLMVSAMAAAVFTISAAVDGFPIFLIADHTPDDPCHDPCQDQADQNSSHMHPLL